MEEGRGRGGGGFEAPLRTQAGIQIIYTYVHMQVRTPTHTGLDVYDIVLGKVCRPN